jgi:hypothetical protein
VNILFLHHSTGQCVWKGGIPEWFEAYNLQHGTDHRIVERIFPKKRPYGWRNYPYDYWNIWVNHAGPDPYVEEPTLEILTKQYEVIVFKHCFPVSDVLRDTGSPAVDSQDKRLEHYKVQYEALRQKLLSFPGTAFVVWTGAALTEGSTSPENARRAREFFSWVKHAWRRPDDNIFIWDFFELQTEGGLYFKDEYAADPYDSHPSEGFSKRVAPDLCRTIVDVGEQWHGRRLAHALTSGAEG